MFYLITSFTFEQLIFRNRIFVESRTLQKKIEMNYKASIAAGESAPQEIRENY